MLAKLKVMSCTQWSKSNVDNFKNCHCFWSICHCSRLCQYLIFIKLLGSVRSGLNCLAMIFFPLNGCQFFSVLIFNQTQSTHFKRIKKLWHEFNVQMLIWMNQKLTIEKSTHDHHYLDSDQKMWLLRVTVETAICRINGCRSIWSNETSQITMD